MLKIKNSSLISVAQLVGHHPAKQTVAGSTPRQDTFLGCGFGPQLGCIEEATN